MKKLFSLASGPVHGAGPDRLQRQCGHRTRTTDDTTETTAEPVELHVFAAASMQESLDQVIEAYKAVAPEVDRRGDL